MEEEKFTDGFKGEGEMLERGGGAHLSSQSHIPGASASSGPPSTSAMAALTSESVESASSLSSKPALISLSSSRSA